MFPKFPHRGGRADIEPAGIEPTVVGRCDPIATAGGGGGGGPSLPGLGNIGYPGFGNGMGGTTFKGFGGRLAG